MAGDDYPTPAPQPAPAPPRQPITISGAGSVTCGTWLSEPQNGPDHIVHQQWLVGFISGYNAFIGDGATVPPSSNGITGWIDYEFCPASLDATIAQAGISLVEFTRQRTHYPRLWPPFPPAQYVP